MERLTISENRRYFVKETGEPFVWIADTVWTMPQRMKWDDIEYLMKKRKSQGFTVLQIVALDPEQDVEMRNPAGIAALEDGDLTKPREQYFAYLDWIFKSCLVVYALLPGGFLNLLRFLNTVDNGAPGCFQGFNLNGASGSQTGRHLRLLHGIPCILHQHLIGLLIQRGHSLCLDALTFQHNRLCKSLFKDRKRNNKC